MTQAGICLVVYDRECRPDAMLRRAVHRLEAAGLLVRGLLQEGRPGDALSCASLFLDDIGTGRRIEVFEKRGTEARGCRLDASGLAEAAAWVREAIAAQPDVLFINRFGRQEAEGQGLLDEIGAAATAGISMVVAVNRTLLPIWHAFAGEDATAFATTSDEIETWCLRARAPAS